jgi:hypothetical protein
MRSLWVLTVGVALLAGCDSKPKEPPDILKTQRQAIEKAKGVEQILQQSAGERGERADDAK